jgi:indolepyruvate ferredoxin oxidoreductase alpha subunit
MMEPSTSQESKDMMVEAFKLSEENDIMVMMRMTTRSCHSKSLVECGERTGAPTKKYEKNVQKRYAVPVFARRMRVELEKKLTKLKEFSESTPLNRIEENGGKTGVIVSGMAYCFAKEVFGNTVNYLKIGFSHPLPENLISKFCEKNDKVYVIEENDPYLEDTVKKLGYKCLGKDIFPVTGELTPDVIRKAVYGQTKETLSYKKEKVVERPPVLCAGCPHRGMLYELGRRKNIMVSGDIGCYGLGFAEPYSAIDFNICMGASISAGHGAQKAFDMMGSEMRVASIIGDSTFFHTGINSLIEVLYNDSRTVNIILDNRITGMTGHQDHPGTGRKADMSMAIVMDIEKIAIALGAKNIRVINPNDLKVVRDTLDWAFSLNEPSVIITRWPCILKKFTDADEKEFPNVFQTKATVDKDKCVSCGLCLRCGCPALSLERETKKAGIDKLRCVGCDVCAQICPKQAILKGGK